MDILLIEDNKSISDGLEYTFKSKGISLKTVSNLSDAETFLRKESPRVILLDVSLPDGNGFDFYKENINGLFPTIFLTAKSAEEEIVNGFELGAEDYITKPFKTGELLARVNKILKKENTVSVGNIKFDLNKMEVYNNEELINLTSLELRILYYLFKNLNRVVTRDELINYIWSVTGNDVNDNTLTVYLKRIREKLKEDIILTVKGIGYRINEK